MRKFIFYCDLCDKEAVSIDTWFNIASCGDHANISPVARQKLPNYNPKKPKAINDETLYSI